MKGGLTTEWSEEHTAEHQFIQNLVNIWKIISIYNTQTVGRRFLFL